MNILILAWRDIKHPLAGGAEKVMHEHAQAWALAGHRVTIFTSTHPGCKAYETIRGVRIVRSGFELLEVQLAAFRWYLFGKHPKFDLVVDQFHGIPFFTPLYVRAKKIAVIQEVAKEIWFLNPLRKPLNFLVGWIGYLVEPLLFKFYKKVPFMTGSASAKEDLISFGIPDENINVVQHGVWKHPLKGIPAKEKKKTVMFLGIMTRDKGIEDAIEIFLRLNKRDPDYQFWVVGRGGGEYSEYIKSMVDKFGLSDKVKFWGFVSEVKKFELLARTHVLIHPAVREGWGLTVIEANLVGTPTVGYNVAGLKDSIKHGVNGYLAPYKDLNKMANLVLKLLNDKEGLNRMAKSSREYAKKFTWEKSHRLSLNLVKNIAQSLNLLILNWKDIKHPEAGGAEQATLEHALAWNTAGHKVTWFASYFPGSKRVEFIKGIKIIRRGSQVLVVQLAAFLWYFFGRHNNFDIVVDQFHGIPFFTPLYVRTKKLAYIHEVAKEVWSLNPWPVPLNLIPSFLGQIFEPWIFRVFYQKVPFMTVSNSTKDDLIQWGINDTSISVIYNGVSVPLIRKPLDRRKDKRIMFLGALSRDKGIEDAIEAFGFINKVDPDWEYWIVGRGEENYERKLRKLCRDLDVVRKTKFFGYVSERKKFELLSQALVLINPSIREGWGLVNIEANSEGTPVVAYNVPGVKDSVKDGFSGVLCITRKPSCLARESMELLENKRKYKKLSRQSIAWSKKFSWKTSTNESLKLLEGMV